MLKWILKMLKIRLPKSPCFYWYLFVTSVVSVYATRMVVLDSMHPIIGRLVEFDRCKPVLIDFVTNRSINDGASISCKENAPNLYWCGITTVYRKGRFVYFVLGSTSIMADDAVSEFFYRLDDNYSVIPEVLKTTNCHTYHIQQIPSARGWYYWQHN